VADLRVQRVEGTLDEVHSVTDLLQLDTHGLNPEERKEKHIYVATEFQYSINLLILLCYIYTITVTVSARVK
jgi:hypothetical protein